MALNGITFNQFVESITPAQKEGFVSIYEKTLIPKEIIDDAVTFKGYNIVAFSEGWCSDCMYNLPVLAKLTELAQGLNLTILYRDENIEEAKEYGIEKIPTFIFFDPQWNYIGRWVERPESVKKILMDRNEETLLKLKSDYADGKYGKDVLLEIIRLLKRGCSN